MHRGNLDDLLQQAQKQTKYPEKGKSSESTPVSTYI